MGNEKTIDKHFENLLVITDKETGLVLMKVAMSHHATENAILRSFEALQGFDDMITYCADNIRAKLSLVVTDDINPKGTELMSYALTEGRGQRRLSEIKDNNQRWRAYKGVAGEDETAPKA